MGADRGRLEEAGPPAVFEDGLIRVPVPMYPPLRVVNSYLLAGPDGGWTVIDPGPRSREAEETWNRTLDWLGASWSRVRAVVLTHHHPDHYGLAGWMQERSGCRVWMSRRAYAEVLHMWGPESDMESALPDFMRRHGLPESLAAELREHQAGIRMQITPQPTVSCLEDRASWSMGGRIWRPVETGGHAPSHLSFYDAAEQAILCGDAVLPQISPNVALLPGSDPQPLHTFLQGLTALRELPVRIAYPGHREPFTHFAARIDSLLQHHEERLDDAEALLAESPLSGYGVCGGLFRGRISGIHQLRFALGEALAHLAELERRGRIRSLEKNGQVLFYKKAGLDS